MKTNYKSAPLPFQGQKRRFINDFREAVKNFDKATVFIDLFGGSGLLSHNAKQERPDAEVIYNDFDNYSQRLHNIQRTNTLLADIRAIINEVDVLDNKRLPEALKARILERIWHDENDGYVDYITLSASILFSAKYATSFDALTKETFYNRVKQCDYFCEGYLDGVTVVGQNYKKLFDQYKNRKDVVFIIDPPYLSTDVGTYKNYWKLSDYLDVLETLVDTSYIYFTSEKSGIVELVSWINRHPNIAIKNPFLNSVNKTTLNQMNYHSKYEDQMYYSVTGQ